MARIKPALLVLLVLLLTTTFTQIALASHWLFGADKGKTVS